MKLGTRTQQPAERLSYTVNYGEALTEDDTVMSAEVTTAPAGLTVDDVGIFNPRVRFWVNGGVDGTNYKVTLTVTTSDGRVFQDEVTFRIKEI